MWDFSYSIKLTTIANLLHITSKLVSGFEDLLGSNVTKLLNRVKLLLRYWEL